MQEGQERYIIKIEQQGGEQVVKIYDNIEKKVVDTGKVMDKEAKRVAKEEIKAAKDTQKAYEEKLALIRKEYDSLEKTIVAKQRSIAARNKSGASKGEIEIVKKQQRELDALLQKQREIDKDAEEYARLMGDAEQKASALESAINVVEDKQAGMRTELRNTTQEAAELLVKWRSMSDAEKQSAQGQALKNKIDELTDKAGELKDAMADVNREITGKSSDTKTFSAVSEGLDTVISLYGIAQGAAAAFGVSEQELMAMQTKFQAVMAASNALKTIQNNLQKESNLMVGIASIKTWALAKAEAAAASSTVGHTIAQRAFNVVAKANPYVLLAVAIVSVVGALAAFVKGTNEATQAEKDAAKHAKEVAEAEKKKAETISSSIADSVSKYKALQTQWKQLKSEGSKTKWIKDNASAFGSLNLAVKNINDADKVFITQSDQVIKALVARSKANAVAKLYEEAYANKVKNDVNGNMQNGRYSKTYTFKTKLTDDDKAYLESQGFNTRGTTNATSKAQLDALNNRSKANAKAIRDAEDRELKKYEDAMKAAESDAFNAESNLGDLSTGAGGTGGNDDDNKKNAKKNVDESQKIIDEQTERLKKIARDNAFAIRQASIEGMQDGFDKERAQAKLEYDKSIADLKDKEQDVIKQLQDDERKIWEEKNPNAAEEGKKFTPTVTDVPDNIKQQFSALRTEAFNQWLSANKDISKKEEDSWNEYLKAFGSYQERKAAINKEYADKIQEAGNDQGKVAIILEQQKQELNELDKSFGKVAQDFADLFADASLKSVKSIQKIIDKYELLLKYMEGGGLTGEGDGGVSIDQLKDAGIDENTIKSIQSDPEKLKAVADQIKQLKDALSDKAPFESFKTNLKKALEQFKDDGDLGSLVENISGEIGKILGQFKEIGESLGVIFDFDTGEGSLFSKIFGGAEGALSIGTGVGKIMSGDILGGLNDGLAGVAQLVQTFSGGNIDDMNKKIDRLSQSNDDLADVMDSLKDELSDASVKDLGGVLSKLKDNLNSQLSNYQSIMLSTGKQWETGSHSIIGNFNRKDSNKALLQSAGSVVGKQLDGLQDFLRLSPEDLKKIQENATPVYTAIMNAIEDVTNEHTGQGLTNLIDQYKDLAGQLEEINEKAIQKSTLLSKNELADEFRDLLADMDTSSTDFANKLNEKLKAAIINSIVDGYEERLNEVRTKLSEGIADGTLSADEVENLKTLYNTIAAEAMAEANAKLNDAGISTNTSQDRTKTAAASVSQETMDEVNGRLTNVQLNLTKIAEISESCQGSLRNIEDNTSYIPNISSKIDEFLTVSQQNASGGTSVGNGNESTTEAKINGVSGGITGVGLQDINSNIQTMQTIATLSQSHLADIARYTSYLPDMHRVLMDIRTNTNNI